VAKGSQFSWHYNGPKQNGDPLNLAMTSFVVLKKKPFNFVLCVFKKKQKVPFVFYQIILIGSLHHIPWWRFGKKDVRLHLNLVCMELHKDLDLTGFVFLCILFFYTFRRIFF